MPSPRLQSRGPIATADARPGPPPRPALHGYKAVAPLRQGCVVDNGCRSKSSPRLQSRGPIATPTCQGVARSACGRSPRLQSRGPIATSSPWRASSGETSPRLQSRGPIATEAPQTGVALVGDSPRLQSRGPIATASSVAKLVMMTTLSTATKPWPHCDDAAGVIALSWQVSPRLQSRGPIATPGSPAAPRPRPSSPRLQSRGPIATVGPAGAAWWWPGALHGYKAVAPLRLGTEREGRSGLRLSTATKPWPHCDMAMHTKAAAEKHSPRLQSRGPIATTRPPRRRHGMPDLSTATKPWPHCDPPTLRKSPLSTCRLSTATKPWPHCDPARASRVTSG